MSPHKDRDFSELDDSWSFDKASRSYMSQAHPYRNDQRLVFAEPFGDGTLTGEIIWHESLELETGGFPRVATFIFRYRDRQNYYYAGTGAFGAKFCIGKRVDGKSQNIRSVGSSNAIEKDRPYRIKVTAEGSRITLRECEVIHITVNDEAFQAGQWGLGTWRTKAEFRDPMSNTVKPRCFLIMPFGKEFDFVLRTIRETVESFGFEYDRADESFVTETIVEKIKEQISRADLIIADLTGKTPNVFYEVGYAAALNKKLIQLAQSVADLPFDVKHLRTFAYSDKMGEDIKFKEDLARAIEDTTGYRL
jgi:hypothetical protein